MDEESCENQIAFDHGLDLESEMTQALSAEIVQEIDIEAAYEPYNPISVTEDFIFPSDERLKKCKGSRVETLPGGQNLGMLDDLEYFRQKVWNGLRIPKEYLKAEKQYELLKAQLSITPPPLVVDKDSDIGKKFIQELRANKFDDAMELVK